MIKPNETYLTFTPSTDPATARRRFEQRFGYAPAVAVVEGRLLWVGPVREVGE